MITIKNKFESGKYGDGNSIGLVYGGIEDQPETHKFRGGYVRIVLPSIKHKTYTDATTFKEITGPCQKHIVIRIDKVRFQWKNLQIVKNSAWMPV